MAYDSTIQNAVNTFAVSFNKAQAFSHGAFPVWKSAFEKTPDESLTEGVSSICLEWQGQYPPKLADVVSMVRKKAMDLGYSNTHQVYDHPFCSEHCKSTGGWVTTSAMYTWIAPSQVGGVAIGSEPPRNKGQSYVSVKKNICGCEGSKNNLGTQTRACEERRTKLEKDKRLDLHRFHHTCTDLPELTHKETMLPWDYDELREKVQAGIAADRGFHKSVRLMVDGGAAMGEHLTGKREDPYND